jgi:hypothetical protein
VSRSAGFSSSARKIAHSDSGGDLPRVERIEANFSRREQRCRAIADEFEFMEPELVRLLKARLQRWIGAAAAG